MFQKLMIFYHHSINKRGVHSGPTLGR